MSRFNAPRGLAALLLLLTLALSTAASGDQSSSFLKPKRPGSREAAVSLNRLQFVHPTMGGVYTRSKSGLLVPDRRLILTDAKSRTDQARWYGTRRGVLHYLKKGGARMSPAPYQKLVKKIRRRAELTLRKEGKSLSSWKMMVLEGGKADQVNAAAWSGGVITISPPRYSKAAHSPFLSHAR